MTEREMLEFAAKAADVKLTYNIFGMSENADREINNWCPLEDDGEAMRLSQKLGIGTCYHQGWAQVMHPSFEERIDIEYGDDPLAAIRHGIVWAAAKIGKAMP